MTREAFEAHFRAAHAWGDGRFYHWPDVPGASCTGEYTDDRTQWAWRAWQAAREAAIEECAKVCDSKAAVAITLGRKVQSEYCAACIRAQCVGTISA